MQKKAQEAQRMSEQHPSHLQLKPPPVQTIEGSAHRVTDCATTNGRARDVLQQPQLLDC